MTLKQIRKASRALHKHPDSYCTLCGDLLEWCTAGWYEGSLVVCPNGNPIYHTPANGRKAHRFANGNQLTVRS